MKTLTLVYVSLIFLLVLTVLLSSLPFGNWSSFISLLVAFTKAVLIFLYFMKIRESTTSLRLVALSALLWLVFLFGFTGVDYFTRGMTGVLGK